MGCAGHTSLVVVVTTGLVLMAIYAWSTTARPFACFLAHESFIRMVPRLLGPQLNRQRKFPRLLPSGAPLDQTVNDLHRTVRVVEPKVPSLHCAGTVHPPRANVTIVLCNQSLQALTFTCLQWGT